MWGVFKANHNTIRSHMQRSFLGVKDIGLKSMQRRHF
jgi:hypothetical protein